MTLFRRTPKTRFAFFVLADIFLVSLAILLAFFLRFDGAIPTAYLAGPLQVTIALAVVLLIPLLYAFRLYWISWSYVSTEELLSLWKAVTIGFIFLTSSVLLLSGTAVFVGFPRSVLVISYMLVFVLLGGLRIAKRIYLQIFSNRISEGARRTLIVGAGDAGEQLVRSMLTRREGYVPVCFVDDSAIKKNVFVHGIQVVGRIDDIPEAVARYGIEEIIVALPSAGSDVIRRAVEQSRKAGLRKVRVLPSLEELVDGRISMEIVREVQVEDLLGREPVSLDADLVNSFLKGKTVCIIGAAGSIGSELSRQVARFDPAKLILFDQDETGVFQISKELHRVFPNAQFHAVVGNIQDQARIDQVFSTFGPEIVFHAAAYKHVPLMEENVSEAIKNNIFGTQIVVEASVRHGVKKFIFISTDKAINPSSVMGATKRIGEMICQQLNSKQQTKFISVRFGNVLDSRGSVIPLFREQIRRREAVEVTDPDMRRYFMITSEACLLVMQAGAIGQGGEVFVLDMGEPIKIVDLAREMIRLSGLEPDKDIPIVFIGRRPGEKLFEEILTSEEGMKATQIEKIFQVQLSEISEQDFLNGLKHLKGSLHASEEESIRALKNLVPSYTSQT